jgi:hypothetical protein
MKCEECLTLLDLYFDGELGRREADLVAAHLGGCASCSAEHQRLCDEQELYRRHEFGTLDASAFWDSLLTKVRAEKEEARRAAPGAGLRPRLAALLSSLSAPRFSPTLTAAMLLAAVGLTAVVTTRLGPREDAPARPAAGSEARAPVAPPQSVAEDDASGVAAGAVANEMAPIPASGDASAAARGPGRKVESAGVAAAAKRARATPAAPARDAAPDRLVREAEQRYLSAIAILSRDVGRRRTRMRPETLARFGRSLAAIDRAIAETRGAAREHPRDPVAVQYMLAAYAKKVEVLREMAQD